MSLWLFVSLSVIPYTWAAERAGDTTALPSTGTDPVFTGPHARYVVTVEAAGARCAVPADFDDDGDMDIVSVSSNDNTVAWYQRLADGTYGPKKMISRASNGARIVTTGDINQDGKVDVIVASYYDHTVGWFENKGGSFGPMNMVSRSANSAQGVSVADMDNDGDLDILSASSGDNTVAWYENLGGGTFCEVKKIVDDKSMGIRTVVAADIDADGDIDMVVASKDDNRVTWYRNDGSMNFQKIVIDSDATGSYSLVVTDVNKDGHLDIVGSANAEGKDVSGQGEGGKVNFYRGDGTGNFVKISVTAANDYDWFTLSVWAGDLDGDGDVDIASASFALLHQGSISWYENVDGNGNSWTRHKIYITPTKKTGHYVFGADMDGDGDNDLIAVTNGDDTVQILYANTSCDDSKTNPRSACCTADQLWNGTHCVSCELGKFKSTSGGNSVCSSCSSACPRQGLFYLPQSCWSMAGCGNMAADMKKCDCGANKFLDKDLGICEDCPDGMITLNDRDRLPADHKMEVKKFLDQTKYMISDLKWQGFNSSRCEIPLCTAGRAFDMAAKSCEVCVAGKYSPGGSIVNCFACTPGHMCPPETSVPSACQAGSFSASGQATCSNCSVGKFTSSPQQPQCQDCGLGRYAGAGANDCGLCPEGTYQDSKGQGTCKDCKALYPGSTSKRGAQSSAECFCAAGQYYRPGGFGCTSCIEGLSCPAGMSTPTQAKGYYVEIVDATTKQYNVFQCISEDWCPEGALARCDGSRFGRSCAQVMGDCSFYLPILGLLLVFFIVYAVYRFTVHGFYGKVSPVSMMAGSLGIAISAMQAVNVYSFLYDNIPMQLEWLFAFTAIFMFQWQVIFPECNIGQEFPQRMSAAIFPPLLIIGSNMVWFGITKVLSATPLTKWFPPMNFNSICNAAGTVLQLLYIMQCRDAFSYFASKPNPCDKDTLQQYTDIIYGSDEHFAAGPVVIAIYLWLFYAIGIYATIVYIATVAPKHVNERGFWKKWLFIFARWRPECRFWGCYMLLRNMLIALVPIVVRTDEHIFRVLVFVALLVGHAFGEAYYVPWLIWMHNFAEAGISLLICALAIVGLVFEQSATESSKDAAAVLMMIFFACVWAITLGSLFYTIKWNTESAKSRRRTLHEETGEELLQRCSNLAETNREDADKKSKWVKFATTMSVYDKSMVDSVLRLLHAYENEDPIRRKMRSSSSIGRLSTISVSSDQPTKKAEVEEVSTI